ncbi:uncharacterized protein [Haliotis asinina]|uniref:uncharacterized protein n=1 Tax=Haliotis asinina TaxID=109174 RepID=UPI0035324A09
MNQLWKLVTTLIMTLDRQVWAVSPCEDTPNWVGYCGDNERTICSYPANVSGNAYSHCKKTCKICESDTTCGDGYYGPECKPCVSRCDSNGQCEDKKSTECQQTCPSGYYGFSCNRRCPSSNCEVCNRWSGQCEGCKVGLYGSKCLKRCSEHCMDKTCDIDSGECIDGCEQMWIGEKCDVKEIICENCYLHNCTDDKTCLSGCKSTWYGPKCDQQCTKCKKKNCTSSGVCQAGCISGFYGNTCTDSCSEFCDKKRCNQTGYCNNCVSGRHGEDCTSLCSPNCESSCYRSSGKCTDCSVGWYGRFCNKSCKNCLNGCERKGNCKDGCKQGWYGETCTKSCSSCFNGSCEQASGHCERGCKPGYHGAKCDQVCGPHCRDSLCDQTSGLCIHCEDTWYGTNCTKECSSNCSNSLCVMDSTGSPECTNGCVDGKKGSYCQKQCPDHCYNCTDDSCIVCKEGFHGDECRKTCPANCEHGCQKDTGLCTSCQVGFYGPQCILSCRYKCKASDSGDQFCNFSDGACLNGCSDTVYGSSCDLNCSNTCRDRTCKDKDGTCTNGCVDGWKGPKCKTACPSNCNSCTKTTCTECKPSWYGDRCRRECPNCAEGNCKQQSGVCEAGCLPGFHGSKCDAKCPTDCKPREGIGNYVYCDKKTGICLDGCTSGHYGDLCKRNCSETCNAHVCEQNSGRCNYGCQKGRHGNFCDRNCSSACGRSNDRQCIQADGSCNLGCLTGWYGSHCNMTCSDGCYEGDCDQNLGLCIQGCEKGFMGGTCDTACPYGRYGYNCIGICGYCRDYASCHSIHGNCSMGCADGYGGTFCSDRMIIAPSPGPKSAGPDSQTIILAVVAILLMPVPLVITFLVYKRKMKGSLRASERDEHEYEMIQVYPSVDTISDYQEVSPRTPARVGHERTEHHGGMSHRDGNEIMDNDREHYNVPLGTRMMTSTLLSHVKQLRKDGGFQQQFNKLPSGLLHDYCAAMKEENSPKNMYKEVYAYDQTRVVLDLDEDHSDYINASFVSGVDAPNKFVASQGPMNKTVSDFWLMIFQLRSSKIVMLNNAEEGRGKGVRYWPEHGSGADRHGNIEIECSSEETLVSCTMRTFKICKILQCGSKASRTRIVKHFQFAFWPDRGIPADVASLVAFCFKVRNTPTHGQGPTIVHCSDGVGRTGTFIALWNLMDEAKTSDTVDPYSCVKRMRHERVNMVQTWEQYEFLHHALIEALMAGGTTVSISDFKTSYDNLLQNNPETGVSRLREQFETLQLMKPPYRQRDYRTALLPENTSKNRFMDILACDSHRPVLSSTPPEGTDYINAVFMLGYRSPRDFLLTQTPLPDTVLDFWRMVIQTDSQTIVTLNDDNDNAMAVGYYWPQDCRQKVFGTYLVEVLETENYECYSAIKLSVREDAKTLQPRSIKLFQFHCWSQGQTTPESPLPLLAMTEEVEVWREATNFKPVTVLCWNGVDRSGLFCVLSAILERLKNDLNISILQTINEMRLCRPQLIQKFEQFQFCYKATKEYLDTFSVYSSLID